MQDLHLLLRLFRHRGVQQFRELKPGRSSSTEFLPSWMASMIGISRPSFVVGAIPSGQKQITLTSLSKEYGIRWKEGQFENLLGKGKPLNLDTNPHADPAEDTLYRRTFSKHGCAPE